MARRTTVHVALPPRRGPNAASSSSPGDHGREDCLVDPRRYYPPMTGHELPEHVARNRAYWDEVNATLYAAPGARAWVRQEITWGIFGIPEDELHFPLIHGNAEDTGLPDASFDLAVSEYGAAIWADPHRWIPEAARIL